MISSNIIPKSWELSELHFSHKGADSTCSKQFLVSLFSGFWTCSNHYGINSLVWSAVWAIFALINWLPVSIIVVQDKLPSYPGSVGNESASQETSSSQGPGFPEFPSKSLNKQIAVVSTLAAVGLFLSSRLDFGVSLKDLAAVALPYEEVGQIIVDFTFIKHRSWLGLINRQVWWDLLRDDSYIFLNIISSTYCAALIFHLVHEDNSCSLVWYSSVYDVPNDIFYNLVLVFDGWCIFWYRLFQMGNPLLWSSMQIGVKYVEN